jgi:single-strand DNA-binding protein
MPSLNRVILIGRLVRDPELRTTATGTAVANFTIAVDRRLKSDGTKKADFIRIVIWGKQGENCSNYPAKGRLVAVDGRLQIHTYQAQDDQNRTSAEVIAENVQFFSPKGSRPSADAASSPDAEVLGESYNEFDNGFGSEEPPF